MDVLEKLQNGAWGQAVSAEARDEIVQLRSQVSALALLAQDVRLIDVHGTLPDGDGVNGPTALWAEEWTRKLALG
jgi:hypothetical protein